MTARPRSPLHELKSKAAHESGLSVDAEELGAQFLKDATEQNNFESERMSDRSITEGSPSDAALDGPDFDADASVWERTMNQSSESDVREIVDPVISNSTPVDPDEPDEDDEPHARRTVDLLQSSVVEASLLDEEDEDGEVQSPEVIADEQDHHAHSTGPNRS